VNAIDPLQALNFIPHPLVLVLAGDPARRGERGGMSAAWCTRASWDPPLLAVSISPRRFTYQLVRRYKGFVIHPVTEDLLKVAMEVFGSMGGRKVDKFEVIGVEPLKARSIIAPVLPSAKLTIECEYQSEFNAGDHQLIIGRVVDAYGDTGIHPLSYLGGKAYRLTSPSSR